ncbi:hypothetical protein MY10362_003478 [Beauveria mimosiformis]
MASTTTDANTPKTGAVKKWDGNAERDLCLAMMLGGTESDKFRPDWNSTHKMMNDLGYNFTKDAINQRWSKTILKEFKSRHPDADLASPAPPTKMTPTKRKKAAAAAAAAATSDEAASDSGAVEENDIVAAAAAATPPATPKGRKRAPAKPKATGPPKPRGRKPKSAATVKGEEEEDDEPTPAKAAVEKPATAKKGPVTNVKSEDAEEGREDQPSPSKKARVEPQEDTEMTDDV